VENSIFLQNNSGVKRYGKLIENKPFINLLEWLSIVLDYCSVSTDGGIDLPLGCGQRKPQRNSSELNANGSHAVVDKL
jgi:hypothetical protein